MFLKDFFYLLNDFYPLFLKRKLFYDISYLKNLPKNYEIVYFKLKKIIEDWPKEFDNSLKIISIYHILLNEITNFFYTNFLYIEEFSFKRISKKNLKFFIEEIGKKERILEIFNIIDKKIEEKFVEKLIKKKKEEISKTKKDFEDLVLFFKYNDFPLKKYVENKEKEVLEEIINFKNKENKENYQILEKLFSFYLIILLKPFVEINEEQILNFFTFSLLEHGEIDKESIDWQNLIQLISFLLFANERIKFLETIERDEKYDFEYKILNKKIKEKEKEYENLLNKLFLK